MQNILFILILITGIVTSYTDVRDKKIRNGHLIIISTLAITTYLMYCDRIWVASNLKIALNPLVGLIIGLALYISKIWRAGDAKLFATYSILLNTNKYETLLPLTCFVLFINSFVIGIILMLPRLIHTIILKRKEFINEIVSKRTVKNIIESFLITCGISWILWPLFVRFGFQRNIVLNFIFMYAGYTLIYRLMNQLKKNSALFILVLSTGFLTHYFSKPLSSSIVNLKTYLGYLLTFSLFFYIIRAIIKIQDNPIQRVAFAPIMFLGCLLGYTDFLWFLLALFSK